VIIEVNPFFYPARPLGRSAFLGCHPPKGLRRLLREACRIR
jgi:hypothetical protein